MDRWLDSQITNISQCLRPPATDRLEGIAALDTEALGGCFLVLVGGKWSVERQKPGSDQREASGVE